MELNKLNDRELDLIIITLSDKIKYLYKCLPNVDNTGNNLNAYHLKIKQHNELLDKLNSYYKKNYRADGFNF